MIASQILAKRDDIPRQLAVCLSAIPKGCQTENVVIRRIGYDIGGIFRVIRGAALHSEKLLGGHGLIGVSLGELNT